MFFDKSETLAKNSRWAKYLRDRCLGDLWYLFGVLHNSRMDVFC